MNTIHRIRGQLGAFLVLTCNLGLVLGFILGAYCDFGMTPRIIISAVTIFFVLFCIFPESPSFLLKQDRYSVRRILLIFLFCDIFVKTFL